MERRDFLKTTAAAAGTGLLSSGSNADTNTQQTPNMKISPEDRQRYEQMLSQHGVKQDDIIEISAGFVRIKDFPHYSKGLPKTMGEIVLETETKAFGHDEERVKKLEKRLCFVPNESTLFSMVYRD